MLQSFPLVRLAALDLDGTLLNRNNEVTLATRQAIARAVEHGVVVVPATGRPLASLPPVVAKLPGIRYAITSNGAAVWDLGDDPMGAVHSRYANAAQRHTSEPACLLHRLMPTEVAREAFDLFQQYDGELSVFSDGLAIKTPEGIAKLTSRTAHFLSSEARQNLTDGRNLHRSRFNWEDAKQRTRKGTLQNKLWQGMEQLRQMRADPCFAPDAWVTTWDSHNPGVLALVRKRGEETLVGLFNFTEYPAGASLDALGGEYHTPEGTSVWLADVELEPYQALLVKTNK